MWNNLHLDGHGSMQWFASNHTGLIFDDALLKVVHCNVSMMLWSPSGLMNVIKILNDFEQCMLSKYWTDVKTTYSYVATEVTVIGWYLLIGL